MNESTKGEESPVVTPATPGIVTANSGITDVPWRFKPGQSGNPSGRPKLADEFRELARSKSIEALERVAGIVNDPTAKNADVIAGARLLIDRGYGSPVQDVQISKREEEPAPPYDTSRMTLDEKKALSALLDKAMITPPSEA